MDVYFIGNETVCNKGPSYFADISDAGSTFMGYLRDNNASPVATNSATIKIEPCQDHLTLSGPVSQTPDPFSATTYITSTQSISNGLTVIYTAGSYIELNNGFVSGTNFIAEIDACEDDVTVIAAKTEEKVARERPDVDEEKITENRIKIYPNITQSNNIIYVESTLTIENAGLSIQDIRGVEILHKQIDNLVSNSSAQLQLPYLAKGLYFVRLQHSNSISVSKLIIQ